LLGDVVVDLSDDNAGVCQMSVVLLRSQQLVHTAPEGAVGGSNVLMHLGVDSVKGVLEVGQ
jgi:hypothetical protein